MHNHVKSLFNLPSLTKESHLLLRELLSAISKNLRALKTLGQPVEKWDTLIIFLITNKLDSISKREWESYKIEGDLPTLEEMKTFLKGKCELLETLSLTQLNNTNTLNKPKFQKPHNSTSNSFVATSANPNPIKEIFCVFCKQPHSIHHCEEFKQLPVSSRITEAKTKRLCINCLKPNHSSWHCKSTNCRSCGRKHHTLLHLNNQAANNLINNPQTNNSQNINLQEASSSTSTVNHALSAYNQQILLSTANIKVQDKFGNFHSCRALLDSGSQSNFITQDLCNLLGLKHTKINLTVTGINHATSNLTHKIDLNLKSIYDNYKSSISCIVTPQITGNIPSASFSASTLDIPKNIKLADNAFNISNKIDVLIGAQLFFDLICIGQVKLSNRKVTLQKTRLGWVLGGPLAFPVENKIETFCNLSVNDNLDVQNQLAKFWELEECPNIKVLSREEKFCESNYTSTTTRDEDGRFFVSIPLKDSITKLGDSKEIAIRRFHALERKLQGNLNLRQQYIAFMKEYEGLGHMTKILEPDNNPISYYLPHHG